MYQFVQMGEQLTQGNTMKYQYRRVDISTIKGIKQAERLQSMGWKVISSGMFSVIMEKAK
jgi:hypothetical protein